MPDITFIHPDGREEGLEAPVGASVMQVATGAGIAGIVAECGGSAICATCHVYVDPAWAGRFPPPLTHELEMLDCTTSERRPESRLSCQLKLTADMHGLIVRLPEHQV